MNFFLVQTFIKAPFDTLFIQPCGDIDDLKYDYNNKSKRLLIGKIKDNSFLTKKLKENSKLINNKNIELDEGNIEYIKSLRDNLILNIDKLSLEKQLKSIGPDLLNEEVNYENFYEKVKKHPNMKIGEFLINKKYFSGAGNYVRCEALYDAKISPFRLNKDLKDEEIKDIFKCTKNVLQKAFKSLKDDGKKFVKKV